MSTSLLEVELRHRAGVLHINISFKLTAPWTVLFGASGSGKTTVLRTIAGFVRPDAGRIVLNGKTLIDTQSRIVVRADRRRVRSAGQSARLFDGMTVRENLLYGSPGRSVDEGVELFRLPTLIEKRPGALSGGERQRVSVARVVASAAACPGALLLLDEPFTGMDFALRDEIATDLSHWLDAKGVPVLSVTHDVGEAFLLGADVVRIADGGILARGPVEDVLAIEREQLLDRLRT